LWALRFRDGSVEKLTSAKILNSWAISAHYCVPDPNLLITDPDPLNENIFKRYFLVWCEKEKDPDPKSIISDPDP